MIKCILLDIEGTTTPIDFVHKTLFPYARERMFDFVSEHFGALHSEIEQLHREYQQDLANGHNPPHFDDKSPEAVAEYLRFLIAADRKSSPLKSIQGKIWQSGYETGALKSVMFADVPNAFDRWYERGIIITIYSSGSILAQKLIFKYSNYGDLTRYISNYFDTAVGHKREVESYQKIAATPSFPPVENFLFISDIVEELDAAKNVGFQTLLAVRKGNTLIENTINHRSVNSFDEI
jgi:enolase-phosphatase E1